MPCNAIGSELRGRLGHRPRRPNPVVNPPDAPKVLVLRDGNAAQSSKKAPPNVKSKPNEPERPLHGAQPTLDHTATS